MKKQILVLLALLVTASTYATDWTGAGSDTLFNNAANWGGTVPLQGVQSTFNKAGPYAVSFPAGGYTDLSVTEITTPGTVTFDTLGTWWLKPANSTWGNPTFRVGGGSHGFNIESVNNAKAQMLMSNAVFNAFTSSQVISNTLQSGLMNLYDPDGIDSGNTLVIGHDNNRKHYVTFESGSSSRWKNINFRAKGSENIVRINGGTHEVFGELNVADQNGFGTTGIVYLAGGELVTRGTVRIGRSKTQLGRLVLAPNGIWTVKADPGIGSDGVGEVNLIGGTFFATNNSVNIGTGNAGTGTVNLISGRFCSTGYETKIGENSSSAGRINVSGGLMETWFLKCGHSGYGVVNMTDGVWTNVGNATVGNNNGATGVMTISGGTFTCNDWLMVGAQSSAIGHLTLAGGATQFSDILPGYYGGDGTVDVTGGNHRYNRIRLGQTTCVRSRFHISGGTNSFYGNDGITVGVQGPAEMIIDGGIVDSTGIRLGQSSAVTTEIPSLLINGGVTTIGTINVADNSNNSGQLILNGGVFAANQIRGWSGAAVKGGNGQALLNADGGTVKARQNQSGFIQDFDVANLGVQGLTIDTAGFDVTVPQSFSNQAAVSGMLVKTGVGTLTLSGANGQDNTVVAGGTLLLSAGDRLAGNVIVTNNAVLSLVGAPSLLTLQTLTVGTPEKPGWLAIDNADTILIAQADGLSLPFAKLTLSSPSTDGVYTLFTCTGNVPSSVFQHTEVSNPSLTKVYTLSATYSAGSDTTDLKLTIQDKSSFVITERVWDGDTDSIWDTAGNWTGDTVPAAGEAAVFPEAPVNKTVTTVAGATAGVLQFNAASAYTLGGSDALTLDNDGRFGEISATAGSHTVSAPLALPRTLLTSQALNTSVTLSGAVSGNGGLTKAGSGQLTLAAANSFKGVMTVNGGLLAVSHAGAFGDAPADSGNLMLHSGTLQYTGTPMTKSRGFTIAADTATAAVVLDAQNDLTLVGQPWANSGALIKRGPGVVKLSVSGSSNKLSSGNGMNLYNTLAFPASGDSPTDGYCGFTVAEGTVLIKGTADSVTRIQNTASIGANTTAGTVSPALEIDGGTVYLGGGSMHTYIGRNTPAGSALSNTALRVSGGAYVSTDTLEFGNTASAPEFTVDNAAIDVGYMVVMSGITSTTTIKNGGRVSASYEYQFHTPFAVVVDNGLLEEKNTSRWILFNTGASGEMVMKNGGILRTPKISMQSNQGVTLAFDNGVFQPSITGMLLFSNDDKHTVDLRAGGATFEVADGLTYTVARPLTGVGGLTKTGKGTLVFGATLQDNGTSTNATGLIAGNYQGLTAIVAGTLAVSNDTIRTDAQVAVAAEAILELSNSTVMLSTLSGNGTVTGGTLSASTISPGMTAGAISALTVDSLAFNGTSFACDLVQEIDGTVASNDTVAVTGTLTGAGFIDFGRTAGDPLKLPCTLTIMSYNPANGTPNVSGWKVRNTGVNASAGKFTAADGIISVTIGYGSTVLILR